MAGHVNLLETLSQQARAYLIELGHDFATIPERLAALVNSEQPGRVDRLPDQ